MRLTGAQRRRGRPYRPALVHSHHRLALPVACDEPYEISKEADDLFDISSTLIFRKSGTLPRNRWATCFLIVHTRAEQPARVVTPGSKSKIR
jgi:hypothetical protein